MEVGGGKPEHGSCGFEVFKGLGCGQDGELLPLTAWFLLADDEFGKAFFVAADDAVGIGSHVFGEPVGVFAVDGFDGGLVDEDLGVCTHEFVDALVFIGIPADFCVGETFVEDFVVLVEERAHVLSFIDKDVGDSVRDDFTLDRLFNHADEVDVAILIFPGCVVVHEAFQDGTFALEFEQVAWMLAGEASKVYGTPDGFVHTVEFTTHVRGEDVFIRVFPVYFPPVFVEKFFPFTPAYEFVVVADVAPREAMLGADVAGFYIPIPVAKMGELRPEAFLHFLNGCLRERHDEHIPEEMPLFHERRDVLDELGRLPRSRCHAVFFEDWPCWFRC